MQLHVELQTLQPSNAQLLDAGVNPVYTRPAHVMELAGYN
jgi:hypothetical protein